MRFREALPSDIPALHTIRLAVKENVLNTPSLVTPADYLSFLTTSGKGWVCEVGELAVGFAIVDTTSSNVWALFVHPSYEGAGIGYRLQKMMLDWYFASFTATLWLTTGVGTRAERFYSATGWRRIGLFNREVRFEMSYPDYKNAAEESAAR